MNIIFLGAPGVGKGTYTATVKEKYGLPHISTGDIFRANIKNNTELGKMAKSYMDKGQLVPDEVTNNMVKDRLTHADTKKGYILDGFPRTIPQAEALDTFSKITVVMNFTADDKIIVERLSGRRTCKQCQAIYHLKNIPPKQEGVCDKCGGPLSQRDDDKPAVISERLKAYYAQTQPLVAFYKKKGLLHQIESNTNDVQSIVKKTIAVLDKFK